MPAVSAFKHIQLRHGPYSRGRITDNDNGEAMDEGDGDSLHAIDVDALEDVGVIDVDAIDTFIVNADGVYEVVNNDDGIVSRQAKRGRKGDVVNVFDVPFSFEDKIIIGCEYSNLILRTIADCLSIMF